MVIYQKQREMENSKLAVLVRLNKNITKDWEQNTQWASKGWWFIPRKLVELKIFPIYKNWGGFYHLSRTYTDTSACDLWGWGTSWFLFSTVPLAEGWKKSNLHKDGCTHCLGLSTSIPLFSDACALGRRDPRTANQVFPLPAHFICYIWSYKSKDRVEINVFIAFLKKKIWFGLLCFKT